MNVYPASEAQVKKLYELCTYLERQGNVGEYGVFDYDPELKWLHRRTAKPLRDGILFYSTGWGWRVRKKPHWREVFKVRFPLAYADLTKV